MIVFWTIIGFIATLGVPLALYQLIFGYFDRPAPGARRESGLRQAEARALSIGISFGSLLLFSLPIIVWKLIGKRKMRKMLGRWADMDRINSGHTNPIPTWKVRTPAIFKDTITLIITIPQRSSTSSFHPNAYLPSYINAPVDADANYFYPYKPAPGLPRMSTIGNVPLYLDEKRNYSV
ncbi:hypothetical protein Hypma_007879 [Hypsizygus marmoreus]|uniref:Uncharacterized protein n=1 Tax=Hypsizygus marmoreus TaxID=39966 RepID=A0A369JUB9_HYPMA|nr:hypothetical protein Hypma_007879 [Hypsizygus marmoreus]